ncbi:MAG TPA: hypothetical protein VIJ28_21780 [Chloroflexota bacterium]
MLSDATLAYGEQITAALLGVDRLLQAPGGEDDDRLVVVNMAPNHQPSAFASFAEAEARLNELAVAAAALPEPDRRLYYAQLCSSTLAVIEQRRTPLPLTRQIERFLHVPSDPASESELEGMRRAMRALLTGMGYSGDLPAQCAAWEQRHLVRPDDVKDVLLDLLGQAWDRTAERIPLPAPKSDGMGVATLRGAHFNARANYLGRTIEINIDPVLTGPALKHLAVHEGYPGHYVQFKLREQWYADGTAPADGLLSVVNSASSCTFEGIADYGLRLIDWVTTDDDRLSAILTHYHAGLGTAGAWRLHALGWSETETADWLRGQALVGGEGWVANRMGFLAAPQRCALITSYWQGEPNVAAAWKRVPSDRHPEFLSFVYGRMHSTQSIMMFA